MGRKPRVSRTAEEEGKGQVVALVSYFIHESAEGLAFMKSGDFSNPQGYNAAYDAAILRETEIRKNLHTSGGFAGALLVVAPRKH
jgi:hypothetical protein